MNIENPDVPCGFCVGRGRRGIPRGAWLTGPSCPDCGGTGFLVTCPEAERLLSFVDRHLGYLLRQEITALRPDLLGHAAAAPAAATRAIPEKRGGGRVNGNAGA